MGSVKIIGVLLQLSTMPDRFRRELLISLFVIIGGLLIFSATLYLLSSDLSARAEKIVADRALISQRSAALEFLAESKKNTPRADVYKQAMDRILVSQDQILDFSRWLDGLARVRQVGLSFSFQGGQVSPHGDAPGYIGFSLDLNGKLDDLTNFLKDIEFQSPGFLINLDNFDLSRNGSNYRILTQGRVFFK